jgi:hypothetical protein
MHKSKLKKAVLLALIFSGIALIGYNYIYKSHRNIEAESPSFSVSSMELIGEFKSNSELSSDKYLDQTIQISGIVTSIESSILGIDNSISCYFQEDFKVDDNWLKKSIIVKGRCLGFDDLMEEIKMDQCIVIKINK